MEKKIQENTQNNKKEIKLLTFQPQQMLDEIAELNMIIIDLKLEIERLQNKLPKSWQQNLQDILLRIFGGQWEENK